jgi:hypothetical protein
MGYKLYTDKTNKFQCTVQVEGTSLSNSQARVILETKNEMSYLFRGKLFDNGVCEFNLPKLKNILSEGEVGTIKLEIIADDVHFEPWSSEFDVVSDKKVSVTVQEQVEDKKPKIVVNEITLTPTTTKNQIVEKKIVEKKVVDNKVTEKPKETNKVGMSKSEFIKMYFNR